ncbi:hypothetical protein ONA91_15755 [Micromonospora sp. DR5-3]|uniref:hypothetical protein n=1 Tax=unclassified Micromonospora TaxID=2617518 RepID=UPI001651FA48|nr:MULTISPECIES: hypothetical protein [unclassified Micromonospora]MCW3815900.1 hypothetical protein [Micromonospora sp. DR5-3]
MIVVIVALILFWVVRYGLGPKQSTPANEVGDELPPSPDEPKPPQHPRDRR